MLFWATSGSKLGSESHYIRMHFITKEALAQYNRHVTGTSSITWACYLVCRAQGNSRAGLPVPAFGHLQSAVASAATVHH